MKMIGKPEWFKYRLFGWGISPKTWQGYVYVAAVAAILGFSFAIGLNNAVMPWIVGVVFAIVMLDVMHIMMQLPKVSDERDNYHQLLIERNCSFAAIVALLGVAIFQTYQNRSSLGANALPFDLSIMVVLGAMLLTKIISSIYVWKKM